MRTPPRVTPGLTLIELLAAAVILSAVAATGAVILRDTGGAAQRAELAEAAAIAVDRWRAELPEGGSGISSDPDRSPWQWRDDNQREWRIRVTKGPVPNADSKPTEGAGKALPLRWDRVTVEYRFCGGSESEGTGAVRFSTCCGFVLPVPIVPTPQPRGAEGAMP